MTTTPVDRLVRSLAVPTVVSMLISALYNIADTFFVGRLGPSATGAIGVVYSLMAVIQAVGFGFGHGSGNYISRKLGEQDVRSAETMAMVGFVSSFVAGMVIMLSGLMWLPRLTMALGSTLTIRPYAEEYLFYVLLGAPFFASSLTLNNQLRLQGEARKAMFGIAGGAVVNTLLDPLFIFTFNMGIAGAGLATLLSQAFSFFFLLYETQCGDTVSLRLLNFRPSSRLYVAILQGGVPSMGRQSVHCVANILLNHAMKMYGDTFFAAMTIVIRLSNLLFAGTAGIGQGFQPVCGFNYGARLYQRVRQAYVFTQKFALVALSVATALLLIFTPQVISLFSKLPEVVAVGITAQRWQCLSVPFMGFCIISSMLLQNINKYREATLLALCRSGIFFIPAILLLPEIWGSLGVMLAQPVADLFSFILAYPVQRRVMCELRSGGRDSLSIES